MSSATWTDALAGMPAQGLDVRPRASRRAPEAFRAPSRGTGLPFAGGAVVETVATSVVPAAPQRTSDPVHIDATPITSGLLPSRRPPG